MADDEEFRTAVIAFLHDWGVAQSYAERHGEESIERLVELMKGETSFVEMFRMFHAAHLRYPTFADGSPFRFFTKEHSDIR